MQARTQEKILISLFYSLSTWADNSLLLLNVLLICIYKWMDLIYRPYVFICTIKKVA